jgi:hypothetical protein
MIAQYFFCDKTFSSWEQTPKSRYIQTMPCVLNTSVPKHLGSAHRVGILPAGASTAGFRNAERFECNSKG